MAFCQTGQQFSFSGIVQMSWHMTAETAREIIIFREMRATWPSGPVSCIALLCHCYLVGRNLYFSIGAISTACLNILVSMCDTYLHVCPIRKTISYVTLLLSSDIIFHLMRYVVLWKIRLVLWNQRLEFQHGKQVCNVWNLDLRFFYLWKKQYYSSNPWNYMHSGSCVSGIQSFVCRSWL